MSALTAMTRQELLMAVTTAIAASAGLQKAATTDYAASGVPDGKRYTIVDITGQTAYDASASGKSTIAIIFDNDALNTLDEKAIGRRVSLGVLPS